MTLAAISLNGAWSFRFEAGQPWRPIQVPGCWDAFGPKHLSGPAWYRRSMSIPAGWTGRRIWLRFDAVSYACVVLVNGREAGRHVGAWDAFEIEITGVVTPGADAELLLEVEKPAGLTRGPDSASLPGRFPLRETLTGFLPYVWGSFFGGIWQDVTLFCTGPVTCRQFFVGGAADGALTVEAHVDGAAAAQLTIEDPQGASVHATSAVIEGDAHLDLSLEHPEPWSPARPALYTARLALGPQDEYAAHFGLRTLSARGATLVLNDRPLYPRMALSWGWYPESLHANPGPQRVREDFARLKSLGFNGVKLCLWVPPAYYFDLADELGMLLWLELPMWLPRPTPFFRAQVFREYEALVRAARRHPAVILYSLGCELDRAAGADLLGPLYAQTKRLAGDALVRDNSGSGEAYGGLLDEYADYDDHHFYAEPHFFRALLDEFAPRWRPRRPWLLGEYCDADTFRDLRRLAPDAGGRPWWARANEALNPQGARWQYDLPEHESRLRAAGLWDRGAELERLSEEQAAVYRKTMLELTRACPDISGYVMTGEADTPISTAGLWDDAGRLKFKPEEFLAANADTVLLLGWDRHRAWVAGGDRPAPVDTYSYEAGDHVRAHVLFSHYGTSASRATVAWRVTLPDGTLVAAQEPRPVGDLAPGTLRELGIVEFAVPAVAVPSQATLHAEMRSGSERMANNWPLWFLPRPAWHVLAGVAIRDPSRRLADLNSLVPGLSQELESARAAVVDGWSTTVEAYVQAGGGALVLLDACDAQSPLPVVAMPFWREALRLIEPHPAWRAIPQTGWAGLQFHGCATDHALDTAGAHGVPLLRRLDLRTMRVHDYAFELELGRGRAIMTTLRFTGGQGAQPLGLLRNTFARYLMYSWLHYLAAGPRE